jgi:hypothetical protein
VTNAKMATAFNVFTTATNIRCAGVCWIERYHGFTVCEGAVFGEALSVPKITGRKMMMKSAEDGAPRSFNAR